MEGSEIVGIDVKLIQVSIGKGEHGVDDTEDYVADGAVDDGEVGDISGTGEIKLQDRWVDE